MTIVGGAKVSELKKPDLKTGGEGGGVQNAYVIEQVQNGYILRVISVTEENEEVYVYVDRSELLREVAKRL